MDANRPVFYMKKSDSAGDLINVSGSTFIKVPCVNNLTFSVLLTNTGTTELNIDANTRLSIKRIA